MSLFYVAVPTREHELVLRQKELAIADVHHVKMVAPAPRNSVESSSSRGSLTPDVYRVTREGRPAEIIVGDDFMEVRDTTHKKVIAPEEESKKSSSPEQEIQAEIEKFFLEKHLEDTIGIYKIENAAWSKTNDGKFSICHFSVAAVLAEAIIGRLQSVGIGTKYDSSLTVCSAGVHYGPSEQKSDPNLKTVEESHAQGTSAWADFVRSIKSRLTVAQVVAQIQSNAVLTFDFLMFVHVAAILACIGLLENNGVILVSSMLISPLMGPIMAITFGTVIRDCTLLRYGVKSELVGLLICLIIGFLFGISLESGLVDGPWANVTVWPTQEMRSRGQVRSLGVGVLMAIPSGVGVALSILAGNAASLVGVAIAASLLPPAVNCGLFWGLAFAVWLRYGHKSNTWHFSCDTAIGTEAVLGPYDLVYCKNIVQEFSYLGIVSFALTIVNIVVIFLVALLMLKVKEVAPYTTRSFLREFWQEDLARARKYNVQHGETDFKQGIVDDINRIDNSEEIERALTTDPLVKRIHTKVGGTGDIALLDEIRTRRHTQILLPRMKKSVKTRELVSQNTGWFSGWFGSKRKVSNDSSPSDLETRET